jgi:hypothetical protein
MKEALRISRWCLIAACCLNTLFCFGQYCLGQDLPWLQVNSHNPANNMNLKPKWTVIISSVQPRVKQIRDNRWEIEFIP